MGLTRIGPVAYAHQVDAEGIWYARGTVLVWGSGSQHLEEQRERGEA
jgi:hypothetical protein